MHQNYFPFEQLSAQVYTPKMGRGRNGPVEQSMKKPKRSKFQERGGDLQVFRTHYKQHHDSLFLSEGLLAEIKKMSLQNLMNILLPNQCEQGH